MPVWGNWDLKKEPEGSLLGDKKWRAREERIDTSRPTTAFQPLIYISCTVLQLPPVAGASAEDWTMKLSAPGIPTAE